MRGTMKTLRKKKMYEKIFVIEQNRDGQMRTLLINELGINPQKLISILNYDGMPITAHAIVAGINNNLSVAKTLTYQ